MSHSLNLLKTFMKQGTVTNMQHKWRIHSTGSLARLAMCIFQGKNIYCLMLATEATVKAFLLLFIRSRSLWSPWQGFHCSSSFHPTSVLPDLASHEFLGANQQPPYINRTISFWAFQININHSKKNINKRSYEQSFMEVETIHY